MLNFYKYHGAGNDFILIDNRQNVFPVHSEYIRSLCNRRTGIGADGLILLTLSVDARSDFSMIYFNADGLEGTMCGNGGRCLVAFARYLQIAGDKMTFAASDGLHSGEILSVEGNLCRVRLAMKDVHEIVTYPDGFYLDTGSPHFVKFVEYLQDMDVVSEGRTLRHDVRFPLGTNVNFVAYQENAIRVRTYERGVENETLSCGTGVMATALVCAAKFKLDNRISILAQGGQFEVTFTRANTTFTRISLEGDTCLIFKGEIKQLDDLGSELVLNSIKDEKERVELMKMMNL
jgi:diaminopimelate epimerase